MIIDPFYPHGFPPCYIPKILTTYEIPIQRCSKSVYMRPNADFIKTHSPVIVAKDSFLYLWKDAPHVNDPPFEIGVTYASTPHIWCEDRKLRSGKIQKLFSYGLCNPVSMSVVSDVSGNELHFLDGITRILYLLVNKAESFPVMCPNEHVDMLINLASPISK